MSEQSKCSGSHVNVKDDRAKIYNLLLRSKAKVTTAVDGLAASAASVIMLAGDEREVAHKKLLQSRKRLGIDIQSKTT